MNAAPPVFSQSEYLSILSRTPADTLKFFADSIIPALEPIQVAYNRTGLVMLPYTDTAQNTIFHLGEVLIAEARVQIVGQVEGYGACLGQDVEQALGIALIDAAITANIEHAAILAFIAAQAHDQAESDADLLRAVESTRAEMATF